MSTTWTLVIICNFCRRIWLLFLDLVTIYNFFASVCPQMWSLFIWLLFYTWPVFINLSSHSHTTVSHLCVCMLFLCQNLVTVCICPLFAIYTQVSNYYFRPGHSLPFLHHYLAAIYNQFTILEYYTSVWQLFETWTLLSSSLGIVKYISSCCNVSVEVSGKVVPMLN